MANPDIVLFDLIKGSWTSPWLDHLMPVISSLDVWKPCLICRGGLGVAARREIGPPLLDVRFDRLMSLVIG